MYIYQDKKWRKGSKARAVKNKYGITLETLNNMIKFQNNKCAICKKEFTETNKPHVDHCHKTKNIREILCKKCNVALGMTDDNIEILLSMLQYLIKHSG